MPQPPDADGAGLPGLEPDPAVEAHPLVARVRALAADLLAPAAAEVDATTVPRSHLDALAAAGVTGIGAPAGAGGADVPPAVARRVDELLAGADLATWFVLAQHRMPLRMVAASGVRPALLADLVAGRRIAGVAFSHLRRRPARVLAATPDGDGWRFDGSAPWYTGWGLNDVALVAALTADDRAVFALVEPREGPHLHAGPPLRTAALAAASTVALTVEALPVPADAVVAVQDAAAWAAADALTTANATPAVFGVAESALALLAAQGRRRGEPEAVDVAAALARRLGAVRREAYRFLDEVPAADGVPERLALRARALRLAVDATTALVTVGAGGAMALSSPAQRKAREALFLLVQAQTAAVRAATLATWTARPDPPVG